jgi:hypothetical protein
MASVLPVRSLVSVAALSAVLATALLAPAAAVAATAPAAGPDASAPAPRPAAVVAPAPTAGAAATSSLPTLRAGSTGTFVTRVQRILAIRQTGAYDTATVAAVKRLQTWKRIAPVTGVVNAATWAVLADPTLTAAATGSKAARAALPFVTWAASVHGRGIAYRESHLSCTVVSASGSWRGKWQMTTSLWKSYGGLTYAATPEKASCLAQDKVAYRVWIASWWGPWGG